MKETIFTFAACLVFASANSGLAQCSSEQARQSQKTQSPEAACPMHDGHAEMNKSGEGGMGFSQTKTTHHFFLTSNGGVIQVDVNRPDDAINRENIQSHLTHIAKAFADGNFDIPMFVHDTVPLGVPEMKRLKRKIHYSFETTPSGGRVVISTTDKNAVAAIQRFLRFQIEEHKTGDPMEVRQNVR